MPFKLTDPGARLEYAGHERLADGTMTEKALATYVKEAGDAGGLAANHLNYAPDKYDFTEYLDDRTFDGIRLAARRLGYNADAQGKAGPKFSETLYEEIRWKVSLPESLFAPPAP